MPRRLPTHKTDLELILALVKELEERHNATLITLRIDGTNMQIRAEYRETKPA